MICLYSALTILVHPHDETFPQSARLALVPVGLVHHTLPRARLAPGNAPTTCFLAQIRDVMQMIVVGYWLHIV